MTVNKPEASELSDYYKSYLSVVPENDMLLALENQARKTAEFLYGISEENARYAYGKDKWQIKEVVGHLCDAERILLYRALRFARKDQTSLSGFEENDYVRNSNFRDRSWISIRDEKRVVSEGSLIFFNNLSADCFNLTGTANGNIVSVRSILFFILAHERHHLKVISERYLTGI